MQDFFSMLIKKTWINLFFLMGSTSGKAVQPLDGMKLREGKKTMIQKIWVAY